MQLDAYRQDLLMSEEISELNRRKAIGLSHIEKNNFKEAVNIYKGILADYPNDIESYLLLGDLYLANEENLSAKFLYEKALSLEPENPVIKRRITISTLEITQKTTGQIPNDSNSVSLMLQGLTGRKAPISENEIQKAADLLDKIVHSENPAEMVANQLENIDNLLPALIELNIRQAKNDRRPDLVEMLQALQDSILQQIEYNHDQSIKEFNSSSSISVSDNSVFSGHIKLFVPDPKNLTERVKNFADALLSHNCSFSIFDPNIITDSEKPDIIFSSNPHLNPQLMESMAIYSAQHIPIIVDLDEDFENMPITHPDYLQKGLGSLEKSRAFTASLVFADLITTPGETLSSHIREIGHKVEVVPFGWSQKNEHWQKQTLRRNTVNIGLIGLPGQFEDVQKIRRIIIRTIREFQQTKLVVCGDPTTYKLFENIQENRRVFLPRVPEEDIPYVLSQIDILLVPLLNTPFHMVQSDQLLMQAGVKNIPWIASPIPDFSRWQVGGVTADTPEEWHSYLRQFIQDSDLRTTLGAAGRKQADQREYSIIGNRWFDIVNKVLLIKELYSS